MYVQVISIFVYIIYNATLLLRVCIYIYICIHTHISDNLDPSAQGTTTTTTTTTIKKKEYLSILNNCKIITKATIRLITKASIYLLNYNDYKI